MSQRKKSLKKALHLSLVAVLIGSIIGFSAVRPPARAAADDYTVSGGDLASLPDVGAAAVGLNQIVITDADGDDVTNDPEVIRVEINTTDYPAVVFDQSVTTFTIAGSCGYTGHDAVTYNSATQLDIPVTGGTSCANGETITIDDIDVETIHAQAAPGANELITVDNWTTSSGSPVASSSTVNLAVAAADASATLTLADGTVGATQNTTLTVTTPVNLANGDTIAFDAPANLDVSSAAFDSTTFAGTGFTGCSAAGQTVTCTVDTDLTAGSGNIVMSGISGAYADAGQIITNVVVYDTSATANIATDANGSSTDTTAADAAATVTLGANSVVGATGDTTLDITLPFALDADDAIDVTFPASVDVSGVDAAVTGTLENTDSITCAAAAQVVTCTTSAATNASGTIIMTGITTLYEDTTDITDVAAEDEGVAGNDIAADSAVAMTDITPADAAATAGLAGGDTVGQSVPLGLNLTVPVDLANGDTIAFDAPGNLDVSSASFGGTTFAGTGFTGCSGAGQTVTCTVDTDLTAGVGNDITINGVVPIYAASGQSITNVVVYDTSATADIATDASGTLMIQAVADAAASLTLADPSVGATQDTTLNITLPVDMGNTDTIVFWAPANLDVSGVAYSSDTFGGAGSFACSDAAQVVTCTANGVISAGAGTIVMSGISPVSAATSQTITNIAVTDTGNGDTATDASGTVTDTVAGTLVGVLSLSNYNQSTLATATASMTLVGALPDDGKIRITFPAGFKINGADALGTVTNVDGTFTLADAGQVLTITRVGDGTETATSTSIEVPIQSVVNPFATGLTGTFTFETLTSADGVIASNTSVGAVAITAIDAANTQPGSGGGGSGGGGGGSAGSYLAQLAASDDSDDDSDDADEDTDDKEDSGESDSDSQETQTETEGEIKESAPEFSDTTGHWAKTYIDQAADFVDGESDTAYSPDKAITGQDLIDAAKKAFDVDLDINPSGNVTRLEALQALIEAVVSADLDSHFAENYTSKENYWYAAFVDVLLEDDGAKFVAYSADMDIVDGYGDGTFGPNNNMTKAELAKVIVKLVNYLESNQ